MADGVSSGVRSNIWLAVCAMIVVGGCGPGRARPDPGAGAGSGSGELTVPDTGAVNPATCPTAYADVHVGEACTDEALACGFAEGQCWCGPRSYCGGAAPGPDILAELARPTWQCKPARTDGCPEAQPSGTCSQDGQTCSYGDCCFWQVTCQGGTWTQTGGGCPP